MTSLADKRIRQALAAEDMRGPTDEDTDILQAIRAYKQQYMDNHHTSAFRTGDLWRWMHEHNLTNRTSSRNSYTLGRWLGAHEEWLRADLDLHRTSKHLQTWFVFGVAHILAAGEQEELRNNYKQSLDDALYAVAIVQWQANRRAPFRLQDISEIIEGTVGWDNIESLQNPTFLSQALYVRKYWLQQYCNWRAIGRKHRLTAPPPAAAIESAIRTGVLHISQRYDPVFDPSRYTVPDTNPDADEDADTPSSLPGYLG